MCCFWKTNKIGPGLNRQTKWAVLKRIIACFCMILCGFALFFLYFLQLVTEKVVLEPKIWFQPANSVWSTRLLVKIHNMLLLPNCFSWSLVFSLSTVAKSTVVKWFSDQFRSTIRRWIVSQWNFRDLGDWALIVSCSGIIQKPWGVGSHWNWNLLKDSVYIFYCFFLVFLLGPSISAIRAYTIKLCDGGSASWSRGSDSAINLCAMKPWWGTFAYWFKKYSLSHTMIPKHLLKIDKT